MRTPILIIKREEFFRGVSIRFGIRDERTGRLAVALPAVMQEVEDFVAAPESPMLRVADADDYFLQGVMDQLWALGVRPQDTGTAGHLAATKAHLEDMRALAGQSLGVTFPKIS